MQYVPAFADAASKRGYERVHRSPHTCAAGSGTTAIERDRPGSSAASPSHEERPEAVEYQVRAARITDIDRLVAICDGYLRASRADGDASLLDAADLLRQLVFLPHASVLVAETRREIAGAAVLALRPSVRAGGFVGTVDVLAIDPRHRGGEVADMLIEEIVRSAENKGCVVVEAPMPADEAEQVWWDRRGFREDGPVISRRVGKRAVAGHRHDPASGTSG
ncbi:MAG TPA: GNAT family N-acetyltransferase [Candidatus Limnocylindrales bacterium]